MDVSSDTIVECRSDYDYPGRPQAIWYQGNKFAVIEVLNAWRTLSGKHFRIVIDDDRVFECVYAEADDVWEIHEQ